MTPLYIDVPELVLMPSVQLIKHKLSEAQLPFLAAVDSLKLSLTSRTNGFYDPWNRDIANNPLFKIPDFVPCTEDIDDILDRVATDVVAQVNNSDRKLLLAYSGGIDSTALMVALLRNGIDKSKLVILLSEQSITENLSFYVSHIHGRLTYENIIEFQHVPHNYEHFYYMSGEFGDQIYGYEPLRTFCRATNTSIKDPWRKHAGKIIEWYVKDETYRDYVLQQLENNIATAPCSIETVHDFFWWLNFSTKWIQVYFRRAMQLDIYGFVHTRDQDGPKKFLSSSIEFYARPEFQQWAMTHTGQSTEKFNITDMSYKQSLKNYIYEFNRDDYYRKYKTKEKSQPGILKDRIVKPVAIDVNMNAYFVDRQHKELNKLASTLFK